MKILVVDDEQTDAQKLKESFDPNEVSEVNDLQTAIAAIKTAAEQRTWPDLVVLDAVFPSKANTTPTFMAGEFLRLIEEISDDRGQELPDVILVSGQREAADQFDTIVEWLDAGKIRDVLPKSVADVGWHVFQAILRHKARQLQRERDLRTSITANEAFVSLEAHGIITCDESMIKVWADICRAARTKHNVFIQGETGTGKELVARAIAKVQRRDIISVNCGALPADLFEAEFFGTVPGSYTGAVNKAGLIEIAGNGVLFCDEAGKLLLHHQTALLRVTDEKIRRYRRVSEERKQEREANCQFIFATSEPILEEVAARRFNPELANRLTRIMIELPPLRERRVDIRLLTNHFLREGNEVQQKNVELTEEVYRVFENATWPGNVRKLEEFVSNIVESDYNGIVTLDKVRAVIGETKFNQEIGDTGAITIKTAPGCQSMEIAIPLDSSELLTRLRAELYATEPETWMALGQETPEEDAQHENEHESIIIAALKSVLNGRGRELLEDCRKTLKKRDDNNPRRVNVYKVLLYLALHPQHAAALTDFSRVLKLSAWESCRKAADALIENFGSHEPDPVVQRYVEKENRNRKMYQLSDAVL